MLKFRVLVNAKFIEINVDTLISMNFASYTTFQYFSTYVNKIELN